MGGEEIDLYLYSSLATMLDVNVRKNFPTYKHLGLNLAFLHFFLLPMSTYVSMLVTCIIGSIFTESQYAQNVSPPVITSPWSIHYSKKHVDKPLYLTYI